MKSIFTGICLLISIASVWAQTWNHSNIALLSRWFDPSVDSITDFGNQRYSGCYGWEDNSGNAYAIIGGTGGTYFIDLSDSLSPQLADYVPGALPLCTWREYKTFGNYVYMASDDEGANHFQIADLSPLPDSVHVVLDNDSIFQRAHTLFIDSNYLYAAAVTQFDTFSSMAVYDLTNPQFPKLLRRLEQDYPSITYVHDMFVKDGIIYASAGYQGLYIMELRGDTQFIMLGQYPLYNYQGFNHSSWITENDSFIVFTDEVPEGLPFKIAELNQFMVSPLQTAYSNPGATAHNPYIKDNLLFMSYYQDGLWVYDLSNPAFPQVRGYYDTWPDNDIAGDYPSPRYAGCWGAFPFFSHHRFIIASDMQYGLFVLDPHQAIILNNSEELSTPKLILPNPTSGDLNIKSEWVIPGEWFIYDLTGKKYWNQIINSTPILIPENIFPSPGIYILNTPQGNYRIIRTAP